MMTEQEWLTCANPQRMLDYIQGKASDRKLRLFACACCRRIWHLLTDERSRNAVEVAERYADGLATAAELNDAWNDARDAARAAAEAASAAVWAAAWHAAKAARDAARAAAWHAAKAARAAAWHAARAAARADARDAECEQQAALLRDIFGNPFRPVALDPSWRTPAVLVLARSIYEDRDFSLMPILADALEEASCDNEEILRHCRGEERCLNRCEQEAYAARYYPSTIQVIRNMVAEDVLPVLRKCDDCQDGWMPLRSPHVKGCWAIDLLLGKS